MNTGTSILRSIQELLGEDINISLLISSFRKSFIWIFLIAVFSFTLVYFYLRYTLPVYESIATVVYKPDNSTTKILGVNDVLMRSSEDISLDIQYLNSKILLDRVVAKLPLTIRYFVEGKTRFVTAEMYKNAPFEVILYEVKDASVYGKEIAFKFLNEKSYEISYNVEGKTITESFAFGKLFENNLFTIEVNTTKKPEKYILEGRYYFEVTNFNSFTSRVIKDLEITPKVGSNIGIAYQNNDIVFCKELTEGLVNEFIIFNKERKSESADQVIKYLAGKIDTFRNELSAFQDSIRLFMIENQFSDPENALKNANVGIAELEAEKNEILFKLKMLDWFKKYLDNLKDLRLLSTGLLENEFAGYSEYLNRLKKLESEKEELLQKVTAEHPKIILINKESNQIREELLTNLNNINERLNFRLDDIAQKQAKLNSLLFELPEKEAEYNRLKRKYDMLEKYYISLLDKLAEYSIARQGIVSDYSVLEKASTPGAPIAPDKLTIWLATFVAVIIASLLIIVARYVLHNTIISVEEIRKKTKANFLGAIPTVQEILPNQAISISSSPKSILSESFRTIRSNLQFINNDPGPKTISVTSSISGEGKTFISTNIAGILALLDKKVVLIDFDMRRPRLNKVFNFDNDKGTSTLLIGKHTVKECIKQSELENLHIITSGPIPPNPAELILSDNLEKLIIELKSKYDYIVFDTPPIGLVTDGLELVRLADYPIYVFRADYSDKSFASNLDKLIDENKIQHLSFVLNDIGRGVSGYYYDKSYSYSYSYGYGYGAGYYVEAEKPKKKSFISKMLGKNDAED
jgi:capsular exopolysaccharide synthesis family protein